MMSADNSENPKEEVRKKRCDYCKSLFEPERPWQVFCKEKCRNGWHNDIRSAEREKARHSKKKKRIN